MKFHPIQGDRQALKRLSDTFRETMERRGILPKNPWKAKRLEAWLAAMGAKFHPGSQHLRCYRVDTTNFVNFKVDCPMVGPRRDKFGRLRLPPKIRGHRESRFVHLEIPWELADKILVLGYLP